MSVMLDSDMELSNGARLEVALTDAEADVRVDASRIVTAIAYQLVYTPPDSRVEYVERLLALPQLGPEDLVVLGRSTFHWARDEASLRRLVDAFTAHHACSTAAIVHLMHNHPEPGRVAKLVHPPFVLAAAAGVASSKAPGAFTSSTVQFVDFVSNTASSRVRDQLAIRLLDGWFGSLWAAYETTAAVWDEDAEPPALAPADWFDDMQP